MRCPKCHQDDTKVTDSRVGKDGFSIKRRRQCINCHHRFTTVEEMLREDFFVTKRDGRSEEFDRTKLQRSISKALEKRPFPQDDIDKIVQQISMSLQARYDSEVPSKAIGEEVMQHLKSLDPVAYIRFASVYKNFDDISQFAQEIKLLSKKSHAK